MSVLQGQVKIAVEALAEQKVILRRLLTQELGHDSLQSKFPLKNEIELLELNEEINDSNKFTYVSYINIYVIVHSTFRYFTV